MDGEIEFRRASIEDYDGIMSIRHGVYNGKDYLPSLFMNMMSTHKGYVGVCNEKIVAFECITFVDDGKTMVTKAIRIKNDMEGQGLTRMMKEFIYRDNQHNTDIQRLAYSFGKAELLKRVEEGKAELLLKQERLYFQASLQSLQANDLIRTERNCSVRKLQKTDMKDIFHSKLETENLFPDGRIIVNWTPYRLLESNIDIFCDGSTLILGSNNEMQLHSTELMTIGFGYSAQVGVVYNLEIFGLLTEMFLAHHMNEHIRNCLSFSSDSVLFMIHYQGRTQDANIIASTMDKYNTSTVTVHDNELYFVEEAFV